MRVQLCSLWVLLFGIFACDGGNEAPSITFVTSQSVEVGETLRLELRATDPDGDRLSFSLVGLPEAADISSTGPNSALLSWSPSIVDSEPGGRSYLATVSAKDRKGGLSSTSFTVVVYPAFGVPMFLLPSGYVLNLGERSVMELQVEVKDDDSSEVDIYLTEAPDGAVFQGGGRKSGYFYWKPTEAQRERAIYRVIFTADDGDNPPQRHVMSVALVNPEEQAACQGTPPSIFYGAPTQVLGKGLDFRIAASDEESQVQSLVLHWDIEDGSRLDQELALKREDEFSVAWRGQLDLQEELALSADETLLVHYFLQAKDNDDPRGQSCDLVTRFPAEGFLTAAVSRWANQACVNDRFAGNDALDSAALLQEGLHSGLRLCEGEKDLFLLSFTEKNLHVSLTTQGELWPPAMRLLDRNGGLIKAGDYESPTRVSLRASVAEGPHFLEIEHLGGDEGSYTLDLYAQEQSCQTDEAMLSMFSALALNEGQGGEQGLSGVLCPSDSHYYDLSFNQRGSFYLNLSFDQRYGDLDLEVLDAEGASIGRSTSSRSHERVKVDVKGAPLYARVYGRHGQGNSYRLSIERAEGDGCPFDGLEGNDSAATAATLFQGVYEGFKACQDSPDWFYVDINDHETLTVFVLTEHGEARLDGYRDPLGVALQTAYTDADGFADIQIEGRGLPERLYYRVSPRGLGDALVSYSLLQDLDMPSGSCLPDRFEPNSALAPYDLESGIYSSLRHCGQHDVDAYRIELPPFSELTIVTQHEDGMGYSDLELRGPDGALIRRVQDYGDGVFFEDLIFDGGSYTIVLTPESLTSGGLLYDLGIFMN